MAAVEAAFNSQDRFSGGLPTVTFPMMEPRPAPHIPSAGPAMSPTEDRPQSALARGVQITEFKELKVNPDPVPLEETDLLLEEHLSARKLVRSPAVTWEFFGELEKLRDLTGEDDLEVVKYLELKVDTQETSLGNFGAHLPNLTQLKLSNSVITSVRDLGSSLDNLSVLWMASCGLEDIDGVASMTNLRELYLAYNEIYDISPCSMLEGLSILDLEGNNIDDISQIEFLALCQNLQNLTLEGNPICLTPSVDEASVDYDYRQAVKSRIPQLCYLDDEPLAKDASSPRRSASAFDDDWRLIEELMEDGTLVGGAEEQISNIARPGTAIRPATGYRPGSALKQQVRPGTSSRVRPGSGARTGSGGRLGSARPGSGRLGSARPGSARPGSRGGPAGDDTEPAMEDASDLTLGGVVCGNPSKALKSRQRHLFSDDNAEKLTKLFDQHAKNPHAKQPNQPQPAPQVTENGPEMAGLMEELQEWKQAHQERQKELEAERAPQILTIDHDDTVSLSSGDDESVDSDLEDGLGSRVTSNQRPASRSYPVPPQSSGPRPRSGADFAYARKYQLSSRPTQEPVSADRPETPSARRRRLQYDASFDARDDVTSPADSPDVMRRSTTRSLQVSALEEARTGSAVLRPAKIRPVIDKNLMRGPLSSPEQRSPDGSRPSGSPGGRSLGSAGSPTGSPGSRPLRGQLGRVPLLPSKMPSKFK